MSIVTTYAVYVTDSRMSPQRRPRVYRLGWRRIMGSSFPSLSLLLFHPSLAGRSERSNYQSALKIWNDVYHPQSRHDHYCIDYTPKISSIIFTCWGRVRRFSTPSKLPRNPYIIIQQTLCNSTISMQDSFFRTDKCGRYLRYTVSLRSPYPRSETTRSLIASVPSACQAYQSQSLSLAAPIARL